MSVREPVWPAADMSRVPYAVFLNEDVYEREQARVWQGPVWLFLGLEAQIPNPGDYITTYAGDHPIVVDRAEDGSLHAFVNSCAHKGTMVVRYRKGNAQTHTCVYHRWAYDLRGNLIGVPFLRGIEGVSGMPKDFDKRAHSLRQLTVESYKGVIFGTLAPDAEPLRAYLDTPILDFLDRMFARPIEVIGHRRQRFAANWKLYYENYGDGYHGGLLHELAATFGLHRATQSGARIPDRKGRHVASWVNAESDTAEVVREGYRDVSFAKSFDQRLKLDDMAVFGWRDEVGDGQSVRTCAVFPSALFAQVGNVLETEQIRPKSATEFELYWTYFGYKDEPAEVRRRRFQQANMVGPAGYNNMEDGEASLLEQRGIRRRGAEHSVLEMGGRGPVVRQDGHERLSDTMVRGFWRYYAELMGYRPRAKARRRVAARVGRKR
jgi:anthranilate 1,2-dioxygenase large subunit